MKAKILKRLRKQYVLQVRNGLYRAFDNKECLGGIYNQTDWIGKDEAIKKRRFWILEEARKYEVSKNVL